MKALGLSSISEVRDIPGLYISDRFAARAASLLHERGIKYILSVTNLQDVPKFATEAGFIVKHVEIEDEITEDLILYLKGCCDWIGEKLVLEEEEKGGVLVHCTQGISRSSAVVIGYVMQTLNLKFDQALTHLQTSRPLVKPNEGFEYQVKVWQQLNYDVYDWEGKEKEGYKRLKEHRERMLEAGDESRNRARFKGIAGLAANFGKRRVEILGEKGSDGERVAEDGFEGLNGLAAGFGRRREGQIEQGGRDEAWERVERMEEEWTRRLIGREPSPWMTGREEDKREEKENEFLEEGDEEIEKE